MTNLYLARARLRRDTQAAALLPLLLGEEGEDGSSRHPGHHLVWSLFADGSDRRRDFLWREMERGTFLILSARRPAQHALFEIDEPKPFAPVLAAGDVLRFSLRANPVVRRRRAPPHRHSAKHDVVMDALFQRPDDGRAEHRFAAIREQGLAWLERQAGNAGFAFQEGGVAIDGYQQHRVARRGQSEPMSFSTLDFDGTLEVRDPVALLSAIARGFGAARAYGCGLMLIRRI